MLMMTKSLQQSSVAGFTLGELLIAVVLVALLFFAVIFNWRRQIDRGYDAIRKKHLSDIKRAFEEYYNDHGCYPAIDVMDNPDDCGSTNLQPYLAAVPCDPVKKTVYLYTPLGGDPCSGYRTLAGLEDTSDSDIARLGCSGVTGCGFGATYNYGISVGASVVLPGFDPQAPPPPPQSEQNPWGCTISHDCNNFGFPNSCPIQFTDAQASGNPSYCDIYCDTAREEEICRGN